MGWPLVVGGTAPGVPAAAPPGEAWGVACSPPSACFCWLWVSAAWSPSRRVAHRFRSHAATAASSATTSDSRPRRPRSFARAARCAARNPGWFRAARHALEARRPVRSSAQSAARLPAARTARPRRPVGWSAGRAAPHRFFGAGPMPPLRDGLPRCPRRVDGSPLLLGRPPVGRPPAGRAPSRGAPPPAGRPPPPGRAPAAEPRAHGADLDVGAGRTPAERAAPAGRPPDRPAARPPDRPPAGSRPPAGRAPAERPPAPPRGRDPPAQPRRRRLRSRHAT